MLWRFVLEHRRAGPGGAHPERDFALGRVPLDLLDEAEEVGLRIAVPALDAALATA